MPKIRVISYFSLRPEAVEGFVIENLETSQKHFCSKITSLLNVHLSIVISWFFLIASAMPSRGIVRSLLDLSVLNVVEHMDAYHSRSYKAILLANPAAINWLFVVSPFNDLPAELAHKILVALKERRMLRKTAIQLLITPHYK